MLVIALRQSAARRDILCGIAVALAALCKIYPIVLLGYFLLYRRWAVVAAVGLTVLGGILLSLLSFSGAVNAEFIRQLSRTAGDKFWPYTLNVSLGAVVAKTLWLLAGQQRQCRGEGIENRADRARDVSGACDDDPRYAQCKTARRRQYRLRTVGGSRTAARADHLAAHFNDPLDSAPSGDR